MTRFLLALLALLVGMIVGGIGAAAVLPSDTAFGGVDGNPPYSYSASTSPDPGAISTAGGWVHEVTIEDREVVTGNATVVHPAAQTVELAISRTAPRTYELAFRTTAAETTVKGGDGDVATTIDWGVSLPVDYEEYVITVDGTLVRRVTNDGATTPRLLGLPQPLE